MVHDSTGYRPRKPRHIAGEGKFQTSVRLESEDLREAIEAEIIDVSRNGFRFQAARPFAAGEKVLVELTQEASGFRLALCGEVRWRRYELAGVWASGCQCPEEIDLESLGNLFLHGILAVGEPIS